jgi:phage I-like protein
MLICALDYSLPEEGQVASIVYIPEGSHTITPSVNGKPKNVEIKMEAYNGEEVAATFQKDLEQRLAANVRPVFDFDHNDKGPASALPKRFYYVQGEGLMAEIEWTGAGRKAVESKDYSYFSPTFLLGKDGVPAGLPKRGPLGALVNEPAFREIPRIAASEQEAEITDTSKKMSDLILAALSIEPETETAEAAAVAAIEALKSDAETAKASLAEITEERDELQAKAAEANKSRAESLVKAAVSEGRIAPKDEDTKTKFIEKIEAGDDFAEEILSKLPKIHAGLEEPIVKASGEKTGSSEVRIEAAMAKASDQCGENASFDVKWELAAQIDPEAFGL